MAIERKIKEQTKIGSIIEAIVNSATGLLISYVLALIIFPLFGLHPSYADQFWITAIFTMVSTIRSYLWRRFFNNKS